MNLTAVTALATTLPALAVLTTGATATGRTGKQLRLYRPEPTFVGTALVDAVAALVLAGYQVKVCEGTMIFTPKVVDGVVVWSYRTTRKVRVGTCVKVLLA